MAMWAGCQPAPVEVEIEDSGTEVGCSAESELLVGPLENDVINLAADGDWVVWTERSGATMPTVMNAIRSDGTDKRVAYQSIDDLNVVSVAMQGDRVVYLESESLQGPVVLYSFSLPEGIPRRVAVRTWPLGAQIAGVSDTHAYVIFEDGDDVVVDQLELATGTPNQVGFVRDVDEPSHVQLVDDELWFRAGGNGGQEDPALYRLAASAQGRRAVRVDVADERSCQFPTGGLAVTPTMLVCGVGPVFAYDKTGARPTQILDVDVPGEAVVFAADGEAVYTVGQSDSTFDVPLLEVSSDGSGARALACDAREVPRQFVNAAFPDDQARQVALTEDSVVWVDHWRGRLVGAPTVTLRRAAR